MPPLGPGGKENAANQTGNVMNKRGHVVELHVQDKWRITTGGEFANYLRENSSVKGYRRTVTRGQRGRSQKSEIGSQSSEIGSRLRACKRPSP